MVPRRHARSGGACAAARGAESGPRMSPGCRPGPSMRILFDQGTPAPLRRALTGHTVSTAYEMGWSELDNGALLQAADTDFDALVTTDQNLRHQQNLSSRRLAILVLPTTSWPQIDGPTRARWCAAAYQENFRWPAKRGRPSVTWVRARVPRNGCESGCARIASGSRARVAHRCPGDPGDGRLRPRAQAAADSKH